MTPVSVTRAVKIAVRDSSEAIYPGRSPGPGRIVARCRAMGGSMLDAMLRPSDLTDGVESLDYWRQRSRKLPWYRIRARREALRMTARWEQRVCAAIVSGAYAPLELRLNAGVLVARTRLGRWTRRASIFALATVTTVTALVAVPVVAALFYVLHAF